MKTLAFLALFLALPLGAQVNIEQTPEDRAAWQRIDTCSQHLERFLTTPQVAEITQAIDAAADLGDAFNVIRATNIVAILWSQYGRARMEQDNPEDRQCFSGVLNSMADQTLQILRRIVR